MAGWGKKEFINELQFIFYHLSIDSENPEICYSHYNETPLLWGLLFGVQRPDLKHTGLSVFCGLFINIQFYGFTHFGIMWFQTNTNNQVIIIVVLFI